MGLGDKTTDWQVCGIAQVAGGVVGAVGLYLFDFYSSTANVTARFKFCGAGLGFGGNASGTALPLAGLGFSPWSTIKCEEPFSVFDLNNCWGRLSTVSVGVGAGIGAVYITAAPKFWSTSPYFYGENVGGLGVGGGADALVMVGGWHFLKVTATQPRSVDSSLSA